MKYKWCKTCIANEWYPLKPPTNYKKTSSKTLIISSRLFQDTIANGIRLWAKQQEAIDKFGDITLCEAQDDINEIAHLILLKFKKFIKT